MRRLAAIALALALGTLAAEAGAQGLARLYPRAQLEADQARWSGQIAAEFRDTIAPKLTAREHEALSGVRFEFPLVGERGDPFEFYSDPAGKVIYVPVLSLRFFSDLLVATAWLNANGYDATSVQDYVGVLFRDAEEFPRAPLPRPLEALGVPPNARDEAAVSSRSDRNFGQTLIFVLAHELGHVARAHGTGKISDEDAKRQEIEADAFAVDLVRRIPAVPLGLESWLIFDLARHKAREEFSSPEAWTQYRRGFRHPLSSARLSALAGALETNAEDFAALEDEAQRDRWAARYRTLFSTYFRISAPFEDQPIAHWAKRSRVLDLRLADLKPRTTGLMLPGALGGPAAQPPFSGAYRCSVKGGAGAAEFDLLLMRFGDDLHGGYMSGSEQGTLTGTVTGDRATFTWEQGAASGSGEWQSTPDGKSLRGSWGRGEDRGGLGEWTGERIDRKPPR